MCRVTRCATPTGRLVKPCAATLPRTVHAVVVIAVLAKAPLWVVHAVEVATVVAAMVPEARGKEAAAAVAMALEAAAGKRRTFCTCSEHSLLQDCWRTKESNPRGPRPSRRSYCNSLVAGTATVGEAATATPVAVAAAEVETVRVVKAKVVAEVVATAPEGWAAM